MIFKRMNRSIYGASLLTLLTYLAPVAHAADALPPSAVETPQTCAPVKGPSPDLSRSEVYKGLPFQPGEEVRYILKYGALKVHVGYGYLRVQAPIKQQIKTLGGDGKVLEESRWHRIFSAEAYTGDWYKYIFAGRDSLQSFVRPWDGSVTKFYINQKEEKPFVRNFIAEKWLDFDHSNCVVTQKFVDHKKNKEEITTSMIDPGAVDAMSAAYKLRTFNYTLSKTERFLVYTSEKNWWLEATPVAKESIVTAIGTHDAYKLEVKTYLGKELQQRGSLFVWVAINHPNHPILRIQGEVTFGGIYTEIDRYTPGIPLDGSVTAPPVPIGAPAVPPAPTTPVPAETPAPKAVKHKKK
ncbi:MAG: DUF3108 domain-containing protein [Chitinophagaceae bacterium]|nr:DUF3108 domain-containing protein [Oligoflexus sp.]